MSQYSFLSAFDYVPLTAPPYPSHQAGNISHAATRSTPKYVERGGDLSSFLCHVLSLERRLRQEEGQGSFIDNNVNYITSRAKLGDGTQFTVYSAQASFKKPIRNLKANEPGQFVAVKVVKPMVDEE
jgi:hypothetical protein